MTAEMPSAHTSTHRVPLALKVAQTAFVMTLVPPYWRTYGPGNFLWFSDVGLFTSVPALWLESPLLASADAIAILVPETLWTIDYATGLVTGRTPIKSADYMFDQKLPRSVRALSLFHLWLAPLLIYLISRLGYDRRALRYQAVATSTLLVASWRFTRPEKNVNWVFSWRERVRSPAARAGFVGLLIAGVVLAFQWPVHLAFTRLFRQPHNGHPREIRYFHE